MINEQIRDKEIRLKMCIRDRAQGACGQAVGSMAEALPGDIVCYGYHVGIYIGGGQMIHAPEPGDVVKVSSVYGSPWFRRCW